ncbi:MAG TPA: ATP-binding cassette domain-containing protein [Candidatus Angelobacter sp.]|nr:ATP-binding cassette domain-containing protein [Candidatus Angelobacter sp.]
MPSTSTLKIVKPVESPGQPGSLNDPYFYFQDVFKSFDAQKVLEGVSFRVFPGETVCVLGRSGVGKSVCLRLIMGFLKPDAGRIFVAGHDITSYTEDQLQQVHKKVTMVFQDGALFDSLTVAENVAFPLVEKGFDEQQVEARVDELLDLVGMKQVRNYLPAGISTGMKRAVAIARAVASDAEAILFDEPTTMVDPLMARRLGRLINRLKTEMKLTSVVVTHDMRLVERVADRVVFLEGGHVVLYGLPTEMEHSPEPVVRQFVELDRIDLNTALQILSGGSKRTQGRKTA